MEEEIEIWKDCGESKKCFYKASNLGRVKSITKVGKKERILKGAQSFGGYLQVDINKKHIRIHRLVAYAFLGPRPEGLFIDHYDRNKLNNKADNLRYVTPSENSQNTDWYRSDILETDLVERGKKFSKEYYEANKEKILEKKKEHYEANKEKISEKYTCDCGSIIQKQEKSRHEKSKKHLKFLNNSINKDEKESISNGREFAWDKSNKV